MLPPPPRSTLFPYTTLFRSHIHFDGEARAAFGELCGEFDFRGFAIGLFFQDFFHGRLRERCEMKLQATGDDGRQKRDRKSTRLNSSHLGISYAVFCLKKKKR